MNEWLTLYILCWPEVYKAHNKRKSSEQLRMLIFELWTAALTVCLALKSDDVVPLWLCVNYSSLLLHSCSIFPSSGLLPQWEQIAPKINTGISKSLSASLMRTKKKKKPVFGVNARSKECYRCRHISVAVKQQINHWKRQGPQSGWHVWRYGR